MRWAETTLDRPWLTTLALVLALAVGLFMRLYLFPAHPYGINQDGAMAAADARALVQYGTDRLGTPWPAHMEAWGFGQMSSLLTYMMAGMFKLFGFSKLTMRLPLLLVSLISIPVLWDFARRTLGKKFGWLALALLLINPWHIMQGRWAIDCALFPHFFLFGAYCLLRGYGHRGWYYAAMVFYALSMYTYGVALYTVPPFLLIAVIVLLCQRRIRWYDALLCTALYLLISAPFLATMILNFVGGKTFKLFGFTIQYFEKTVRTADIALLSEQFYLSLMRNAGYLLNVVLFQYDGYLYMDLPGYGSNYLFSMPMIVVGISAFICDCIQKRQPWLALEGGTGVPAKAHKDHNESAAKKPEEETERKLTARWGMLLIVLWFLAAIWMSINTINVHLGRAALIMYPVILMIAYAVCLVGKRRRVLAWVLVACFALGTCWFGRDYFSANYQHKLGRAYYYEMVEALEATRGRPMDTLYITYSLPDENMYGIPEESLIEYALELDSRYMYGDKVITDPDGRVWKPFAERYKLVKKRIGFSVNPNEEALYLIYGADKELFDPQHFSFEQFGEYYLATPNVLKP